MPPDVQPKDDWRVSLDVDPQEVLHLQLALPNIIPAERYALITGALGDGPEEAYLTITVTAGSHDEAVGRAVELYHRVRRAAGVGPPPEVNVVGYITPLFAEPLYERLETEAEQLLIDGRHALAVIRAQTAVEVYVRTALEVLLSHRGDQEVLPKLITRTTPSLRGAEARALLLLLTGQRIDAERWWGDYVHHLKRRNAIVHEGLAVDDEEARASLDVCAKVRRSVQAAWAGVPVEELPSPVPSATPMSDRDASSAARHGSENHRPSGHAASEAGCHADQPDGAQGG